MLERVDAPNGVVFYASPLLRSIGVPHAFSTRIGGASMGVFASLNFGSPNDRPDVADAEANIAENHRRLLEAAGFPPHAVQCRVHQVHGGDVLAVEDANRFEPGCKADAMVTADPRAYLAIRTADCVPILLARRDGRRVAAVHAGWRGVIAGVAANALRRLGTSDSVVAIGPSISVGSFEVGEEVAAAFGNDSTIVRRDFGHKPHVDLPAALRKQLANAGVRLENIDAADQCTVRDADEFFSHRRDRGLTGRMVAIIRCAECPSS